jgi:glutathione S-transferase
MPITFGYWGIKGLGEPTRLVLTLAGQTWEEYNPASREAWGEAKATSTQDFPNLPYIDVDGYQISESSAIPWYIAKKFRADLAGNTIEEEGQILQVIGVLNDVKSELFKCVFNPEYKDLLTKAGAEGKVPQKLALLSKFLGENSFLVGNHVTIADVWVAFFSHFFGIIFSSAEVPNPFEKHANLIAHEANFFAQTELAEYVASPAWKKPPMPPTAVPWVKF